MNEAEVKELLEKARQSAEAATAMIEAIEGHL